MLEMGFIVGLGLLVTFAKLSWRKRLQMLSYPLSADLLIFALLLVLHWGTFSGVMVATIGALTCSLVLGAGRWLFGFIERGVYKPGKFPVQL